MHSGKPSTFEAEAPVGASGRILAKRAALVVKRGLPYAEACDLQNRLVARRRQGKIPDVLLLTEHPPVYTFGKSGKKEHLLLSDAERKARGIELYWADRGGDITYHGPGQLVGYPIFDMHGFYLDIGRFLRDIEECLILALQAFGLSGERVPGRTGVWVQDEKIASIGIKLTRWVTKHGFALNVNNDLANFQGIIPCGIADKKMTSVRACLGSPVEMEEVIKRVRDGFEKVFNLRFQREMSEHLHDLVTEA